MQLQELQGVPKTRSNKTTWLSLTSVKTLSLPLSVGNGRPRSCNYSGPDIYTLSVPSISSVNSPLHRCSMGIF